VLGRIKKTGWTGSKTGARQDKKQVLGRIKKTGWTGSYRMDRIKKDG
jgi:hypothetical protein